MRMSNLHHIFSDESFNVYAEEHQGHIFLHMDVYKMSPSLMKKWREIFKVIKEEAYLNGINHLFAYTQNLKFCQKVDKSCKVLNQVFHRGKTYEVIVWDLIP